MKKVLFTVAMALAASAVFAQFNQGRMLAGGDFQFSSNTEKGKSGSTEVTIGKTTSFSLGPQFGYFLIDNLAVGASLSVTTSKFKPEDDNDPENSGSELLLAPFVRYYLSQGIFFQGQFGIGSSKEEFSSGNVTVETKYGLSSIGIGAGYAYFLNDHVAIEPLIGYSSVSRKEKDSDPEVKEISSGLFLRVGFQVYLGNK
jgi:outer membrane protein W